MDLEQMTHFQVCVIARKQEQALTDCNASLMEQTELADRCRKQAQTLVAERDHARANHADVVKRLKLASERPDLPVDRIPAIKELERLQAIAAAPQQHAQARPVEGEWREAERIRDLPAVHEAIQGFADDPTGDHGAFIVREVMRALSGQYAQAALSDERESQAIAQLRKSLSGWQEECEALRHDRDSLRQRLDLQALHQKNDVWYWQGDGSDYPESISNSMAVVIRGDQLRAILAAHSQQPAAAPAAPFQQRVQPWMMECFGAEISADCKERNHRFFEESTELVQACGMTASEAHQLVDYTFGRDIGEPAQEVGGVMVTLAALCLANGMDMHAAGETELARIWTKVDVIRAKQASKPKHSPLPAATPAIQQEGAALDESAGDPVADPAEAYRQGRAAGIEEAAKACMDEKLEADAYGPMTEPDKSYNLAIDHCVGALLRALNKQEPTA